MLLLDEDEEEANIYKGRLSHLQTEDEGGEHLKRSAYLSTSNLR